MSKIFSGKREIYIEVAERYARYIRMGVLKEGEKLPSVRVSAEELGVNPNTVQKAYCHLEEMGLVYSLPKKGVFVSDSEPVLQTDSKNQSLALQALHELKARGVTQGEILSMLKEVYGDD